MNEKIYYSAEDIAKMLGVSMGKAYKILREINKDLASKGFLTIAGKIPMEYFKEKWYGGAKEVSAWAAMQGFYVRAGRVSRKYLDSKVYDLCDKTA